MAGEGCWHCGTLTHATRDHVNAALQEQREALLKGLYQTGDGRRGTWMQTFTGRKFYPLDPRADEITIEDVAHGLAMTCRYGGHTRRFYSVAEHAVLVSLHVPEQFALHGLLHDSAEAYIGDMIRPLKHQPEMREFREAEGAIEVAVAQAFGLEWSQVAHAAVKEIDDRILVDEIGALMADPPAYWERHSAVAAVGVEIAGWEPAIAEGRFLDRYLELTGLDV
jgi:hypothetical protein